MWMWGTVRGAVPACLQGCRGPGRHPQSAEPPAARTIRWEFVNLIEPDPSAA